MNMNSAGNFGNSKEPPYHAINETQTIKSIQFSSVSIIPPMLHKRIIIHLLLTLYNLRH